MWLKEYSHKHHVEVLAYRLMTNHVYTTVRLGASRPSGIDPPASATGVILNDGKGVHTGRSGPEGQVPSEHLPSPSVSPRSQGRPQLPFGSYQ